MSWLPSPCPVCPLTSLAWKLSFPRPLQGQEVEVYFLMLSLEWGQSCSWRNVDISGSLVSFLEVEGEMLCSDP